MSIGCVNLGDALLLGNYGYDENYSIIPAANSWKIKYNVRVDGTLELIFSYIDASLNESTLYTFNPPSSLNTS